jgi:hypothetical protein
LSPLQTPTISVDRSQGAPPLSPNNKNNNHNLLSTPPLSSRRPKTSPMRPRSAAFRSLPRQQRPDSASKMEGHHVVLWGSSIFDQQKRAQNARLSELSRGGESGSSADLPPRGSGVVGGRGGFVVQRSRPESRGNQEEVPSPTSSSVDQRWLADPLGAQRASLHRQRQRSR